MFMLQSMGNIGVHLCTLERQRITSFFIKLSIESVLTFNGQFNCSVRLLPLGHAFVYDGSKVEEWPWEMCSSWQSSPPKYDNETWILLLYTVHVVLLLHLILVRFNLAGHENLAFICECHWMLMYLCIYIYTWDIY